MKKLLFLLILVVLMNANPYDFDPYNDNPGSTFALVAAASPLPQGDRDCWGSDKPCADGKYRDREGKEQPDSCSNDYAGPDTGQEAHSCACNRTRNCPEIPAGGAESPPVEHESPDCRDYCRGDHCHCKSQCESHTMPVSCPTGHA